MTMFGLMRLVTLELYLLVGIVAIFFAGYWAKRRGRRRWLWSMLAAIVMYHLIAWEVIPTYLMVKYYCATEAGLKVYKPIDQWKSENPGVAETLTWENISPVLEKNKWPDVVEEGGVMWKRRGSMKLNERIASLSQHSSHSILPVHTQRTRLIDIATGDTLASLTSVWGGYPGGRSPIFLFINIPACDKGKFYDFQTLQRSYKELGQRVDK